MPRPHTGPKKRGGRVRGRESGRRRQVGKGEGGLDLDICPGAPEFLVTPLTAASKAGTDHAKHQQIPGDTAKQSN